MAHGFSAVKEMYLSYFAERFVGAGFITLVFDYRYFGESEGEPRGQFFPFEQIKAPAYAKASSRRAGRKGNQNPKARP